MNSYERKRRICKVIVLVLGILSINNIILTIRNYSYAYFEKNVKTGVKLKITTLDEMPVKGSPSANTLKEKLVPYATANSSSFGGGLVAVNTNGTLYNETSETETIREYRYSGLNVNNYIYYNCKDKDDEGNDVEQNADNCEVWRIIGIFKDEDGNEHLKIINNKVLTGDMFPTTFSANNTIYKIQSSYFKDRVYLNYIKGTSSDRNNWATAGLQYWLNAGSDKATKSASDGYMSYLSENAKEMIEETKYYLGNVVYYNDTAISAYTHERDVARCVNNTGSSATASGCRVWSGNNAIWPGKIALMYPSDYGYTANNSNWDSKIYDYGDGAKDTSWMYKNANLSSGEWLLSPPTSSQSDAIFWRSLGDLYNIHVYDENEIRPTLYIKSQAIIFGGEGTSDEPYKLKLGN